MCIIWEATAGSGVGGVARHSRLPAATRLERGARREAEREVSPQQI